MSRRVVALEIMMKEEVCGGKPDLCREEEDDCREGAQQGVFLRVSIFHVESPMEQQWLELG